MVMIKRTSSLLVGILFALSPLLAFGSYIDFTGQGGATGSSYIAALYDDGTFGGKGDINNVYGGLTDKNSGFQSPVTNGYYLFNTGNLALGGSGGSIELYGGIADMGIADGTKLAWGNFNSASLVITSSGSFQFTASVKDEKFGPLVDFYYLERPSGWTGSLQVQGPALSLQVDGFVSSAFIAGSRIAEKQFLVASTDFLNQPAPPVSVPEPGTLILLGSGLIGLAVFAKNKFRA